MLRMDCRWVDEKRIPAGKSANNVDCQSLA
jgi:hypothetical protein